MKKKNYLSPAIRVREIDLACSILAGSAVTVSTQQDDDDGYSIEPAMWNGVTVVRKNTVDMEDGAWNN